ncbi:tetratricopeptide repeat protein [Chitinimonas taiwanensis]|uniref:Tetratricopeptide repeat-containing protein n=1 Tax=Chitinimonas taiwanensis DSM 18899 TaxID=1121279 RepID=A0A1K2HKN0_9NEIS|nr:tetratricopeptide repeat protein [Chitinimonas taiwanensis]SFZ77376.1 Tetratricopeptide repeat-containing protein [Chitinimonas taiwanensis DSM 18899]
MMLRLGLLLGLATLAQAADIDALWNYDRPDQSEQRFRVELIRAEQASDAASATEVLTQLARAQGLQNRMPDAHATLDRVRSELPASAPYLCVRYVLERGRLWNSAGERKRAWRWFRAAHLLAVRQQLDYLAIDALHMLAIAEGGKAALEWNRKALAAAERSNDPRAQRWLGSLYNNLGWVYYDQKDYPQSLAYLQKAQAWHEARQTGRPLLIARWSVAKLQRVMGQPEAALRTQLALEQAWQGLGEEDGYVYEEVAENLLALGRGEDARPYFGRAFNLLARDPWVLKNEGDKLRRLRQLSQ